MFHVALKLRLVDLNYNFECDWLIELSDDKLSDNYLASELVENNSFFKPITIEEIIAVESTVEYSSVSKDIRMHKAKGSILNRTDPFPSFVCQTADDCNNRYRPLSRNAQTKDFARLTSHPVRG